jgi:phage FluMu protein gp41
LIRGCRDHDQAERRNGTVLTENVRLIDGVKFGDETHRDVVLRIPLVRDAIEAEEEAGDKGMGRLSLTLLSKQIVQFGAIPKERITADLLLQLTDVDYERLGDARDCLKTKAVYQSAV